MKDLYALFPKLPSYTIKKGMDYSDHNKVKILNRAQNSITANVYGNETYETNVEFDQKLDKIVNSSCTCPAKTIYGYCKHEVALANTFIKQFENTDDTIKESPEQEEKIRRALSELAFQFDSITDTPRRKALILETITKLSKDNGIKLIDLVFLLIKYVESFSSNEINYLLFITLYDTISLQDNKVKFLKKSAKTFQNPVIFEKFFSSNYINTNPVIAFQSEAPEYGKYAFMGPESLYKIGISTRVENNEDYFKAIAKSCSLKQYMDILKHCRQYWVNYFYNSEETMVGILFDELVKLKRNHEAIGIFKYLVVRRKVSSERLVTIFPLLSSNDKLEIRNYFKSNNIKVTSPELRLLTGASITATNISQLSFEALLNLSEVIISQTSTDNIQKGLTLKIDKLCERFLVEEHVIALIEVVEKYKNCIYVPSLFANSNILEHAGNEESANIFLNFVDKYSLYRTFSLYPFGGTHNAF